MDAPGHGWSVGAGADASRGRRVAGSPREQRAEQRRRPHLGLPHPRRARGRRPRAHHGGPAVPIFQTTSFVFEDAADAANLFALQKYGNIYSRISNPTVAAFEERIASSRGGSGPWPAPAGSPRSSSRSRPSRAPATTSSRPTTSTAAPSPSST